ncbi:hypothetical protein MNBD_GAMMA13-628, partial [hydrothermal vent metagenome]
MSLTRRSLLIILAIALLAIVGQWGPAEFGVLWRYPAALLLIGLTLEGLRLRLNPIQLSLQLPAKMELGRDESIQLTIHNPHQHNIQLMTQSRFAEALHGDESVHVWSLAAVKSKSKTFSIVPAILGETVIAVIHHRSLGHLKLAWWSNVYRPQDKVCTHVQSLQHSDTTPGQLLSGERYTRNLTNSGDSLLALRDYKVGDPLRSIDWKATARRQQTTVRIFAREQELDIMLIIDAGRSSRLQAGTLPRLGHYVNIAARLAQMASLQGDRTGLMSFASHCLNMVPLGNSAQVVRAIRTQLDKLLPQCDDFNPLAAALEAQRLLQRRSLVIFLCELEQHEAARQLASACK